VLIRYKARYVFAWNPISRHELHSSNCQVLLCVPWVSVNMILSVHRHIPQREKTLSDLYFLLVVRRYFSVATRLTCTTMIFLLERKGRFTPWIMTSGHGRWLFSMVRLPWSNFHDLISFKKSVYKVFGSLTRCKPPVNQEEWPCTKKWVCWFFLIYVQIGNFQKKIKKMQVWPLFCLLLSSSSLPTLPQIKYIIITIFPCHGPLPFFYHSTSFAFSHRKNPLDHVSG
jgi:hypothetical protein